MSYRNDNDALTVMDWFCGAGGSSQGAHAVPGLTVARAANHWERAIESHAVNFPDADHYRGDIRKAPVWAWPVTDIFWASPECTNWSVAKGKKRDFANAMQGDLLDLYAEMEREKFEADDEGGPSLEEESRALMEEVPLYLRGVISRGGLVKAGIVENVVDVRQWDQWDRWIGEIHKMGYRTRIIALNSMHADPRSVHRAPQSRDRLYVGYWHESLGRTPDWDKWLRPRAWCPTCDQWVQAVQTFKRPGVDMGRYRQQYVYRCPHTACRNSIVEPEALPALAAVDWSIPGQRIGDKPLKEFFSDKAKTTSLGFHPLAPKTLARIQAGLAKFAQPLNDGRLAVPPLMVPVEGRDGKEAGSAHVPLRTQTARNETGLAWMPFVAELRGGGSVARSVSEALATVCASGNHHGLVTPDVISEHMLIPYYGASTARPVTQPVGALTTRDRYALVHGQPAIEDVRFRMLEPHEIGRAMSFADDYTVLGSKRERVRQYGNAVTPNAAEVLLCALVEAITGETLDRHATPELAVAA
ncbi:DNA cytosine methyltransferase [Streptomyces sp. NPDC093589]|uniref:DNA cytosine methyltransferase n=1 Tax=Streptomyces sp. NPDC093589 TaxID=3366043 RepID=UPI0038226586